MREELLSYLKNTGELVEREWELHPVFPLAPEELQTATFAYFLRGGKRLRPALVCLAAGAFGGKEKEAAALPCALGLEFYHNWTLIHDDIIDNDSTRRGQKSVHAGVADAFAGSGEKAAEYGRDIAILAGDALHSAAVAQIARLAENGVSAEVALKILSLLEGNYGLHLISGEALDTRQGVILSPRGFWNVKEEEVLEMIRGKTGALFAVSVLAGGMIGLDSADETDPRLTALCDFAFHCGTAFQLQDDILGLTSDEKTLGKPIFSDLREGKPTLLLLRSYANASENERCFLRETVGKNAAEPELVKARDIILKNGGVKEAAQMAFEELEKAKKALLSVPAGKNRDLLEEWRCFMADRKL